MLEPTLPTSPTTDSTPTTPSSTSSGPFSHSHRDSISTISTISSAQEDEQHRNAKSPSTEAELPSQILSFLSATTKTTLSATEAIKLDPLSRDFPKPTCTATIDELLARTPGKWSLNHYVKHVKEVRTPTVDPEARAKKFEEAKRELLMAKKKMDLEGRDLGVRRWGP